MATSELTRNKVKARAWVTLVTTYLGSMLFTSTYYMNGVLFVALLEYFKKDPVKTSLVGSLNAGLLCLLGPFVGILTNMYSCRVVTIAGGVTVAVSYFISAFVPSVDWLIITFGILGGTGGALIAVPTNIVIGYCFTEHRDILIGLLSAMNGLGMLIATPFGLYSIGLYGIKGTFIILSGVNLNLCVVGMLMKPSVLERQIKKDRELAAMNKTKYERDKGLSGKAKSAIRLTLGVFLDVPFVLFLFGTLAWNLMLAICLMHLPNYMDTRGDAVSHISAVMVCFSISNTVGRLVGAMSLAKASIVDPLALSIFGLVMAGACAMTFPLYNHLKYADFLFVIITGSLTGIPNALATPLIVRLMGLEHITVAFGWMFFASGLGYVAGAPIASALYKRSNSYDSSFLFAGSVSLAGSCCMVISSVIHKRRNRPTEHEEGVETTIELMAEDRNHI